MFARACAKGCTPAPGPRPPGRYTPGVQGCFAIARSRRSGIASIARYDSAGGERLVKQFELDLAAAIATSFVGTPQQLCQKVRHKVPSAKPCRMPAVQAAPPSRWVKGMNSPETRGQLRVGDLSGWGTQKLLGVAAALGAKGVRIELLF